MIKSVTFIILLISFYSCASKWQKWEDQWKNHSADYIKVVELFKQNKLVHHNSDVYEIPNTVNINLPVDKIVFSHKDSSNDRSCTLLFYIDSTVTTNNSSIIVYTDNNRIIEFYKKAPFEVKKIENHWYFLFYNAKVLPKK